MKQGIVTAIFVILMGLMVCIVSGCATPPAPAKPLTSGFPKQEWTDADIQLIARAPELLARVEELEAALTNERFAGNVIGELKLVYNKTRQAAITKELSEIVSGAAAISG
jgi:hypothetical protein